MGAAQAEGWVRKKNGVGKKKGMIYWDLHKEKRFVCIILKKKPCFNFNPSKVNYQLTRINLISIFMVIYVVY